jgi:hypothetical protein
VVYRDWLRLGLALALVTQHAPSTVGDVNRVNGGVLGHSTAKTLKPMKPKRGRGKSTLSNVGPA